MKCMLVKDHGNIDALDDILYMSQNWPRPKRGKGQTLIRVQACSLAPGDVRTMSGMTKFVQMPKSGFPYIPGGDVVGIVEEEDPESNKFRVGDCVVARFHDTPSGGLAEYCAVKTSLAAIKPESISAIEAAALPASVVVAVIVVQTWVRQGDRVLVLGATGGVGSHVVQLLKGRGASFVAAAARDVSILDARHVDRTIDYTKESWWDTPEFKASKFDLILDFAAFPHAWANCGSVLKTGAQGGRFITTAGDTPYFQVLSMRDVCGLLIKLFGRSCWTGCAGRSVPKYSWFIGGLSDPITDETWAMVFKAIEEGHLKPCLDPSGPFPFSEAGVRQAFALQAGRHAHGKVVISGITDC
mmetsp:Transcript_54227/g.101661  ORF Transcript_54227/g.101661 Transcript_54227/m.101661 type:complete len:356 (-) Transcript_54227:178-1245(-)